jgi:hypothetical protein
MQRKFRELDWTPFNNEKEFTLKQIEKGSQIRK